LQDQYDFNWDTLVGAASWETAKTAFIRSDIVALGYWSHIPAFDEIVTGLCENFLIEGGCKHLLSEIEELQKCL